MAFGKAQGPPQKSQSGPSDPLDFEFPDRPADLAGDGCTAQFIALRARQFCRDFALIDTKFNQQ